MRRYHYAKGLCLDKQILQNLFRLFIKIQGLGNIQLYTKVVMLDPNDKWEERDRKFHF